MFQIFNHLIKRHSRKINGKVVSKSSSLLSRRAQVAVILVLVFAVALIFFAATLNLGRINQSKTAATLASNQAAAFLASEMASYAEYYYQHAGDEEFGDDLTACKHTDVFTAVVTFIASVILAVIVTIATGGSGASLAVGIIIAAVATAISISISLTEIEPGITDQWNKMLEAIDLDIVDGFLERGVMLGLQNAVMDQEKMIDFMDMDMDGMWGPDATDDKVSRLTYHMHERVSRLALVGADSRIEAIEKFQKAIGEFLLKEWKGVNDNWGLWDPVGNYCPDAGPKHECCEDPKPAYCNCCCLPKTEGRTGTWFEEKITTPFGKKIVFFRKLKTYPSEPSYNNTFKGDSGLRPDVLPPIADEPNLRPSCCDTGGPDECGVSTDCPDHDWPNVYDRYAENKYNNNPGAGQFVSFREFVGRDDNNRYWRGDTRKDKKTSPLNPAGPSDDYEINIDPASVDGFWRQEDAEGILYPYFWKLAKEYQKWNLPDDGQSGTVGLGPPAVPEDRTYECDWCHSYHPDCGNLNLNGSFTLPTDSGPQVFAFDFADSYFVTSASTAPTCGFGSIDEYHFNDWNPANCCITNNLTDNFHYADDLEIPQNECPDLESEEPPFWKKGVDDFCSVNFPYQNDCPGKHCDRDCHNGWLCARQLVDHDPEDWDYDCAWEDPGQDLTSWSCPPPGGWHYWVEDNTDYSRVLIDEFIDWAKSILNKTPERLHAKFSTWIAEAMSVLDSNDGKLMELRESIDKIHRYINGWANGVGSYSVAFNDPGSPAVCNGQTLPGIINCLDNQITNRVQRAGIVYNCMIKCAWSDPGTGDYCFNTCGDDCWSNNPIGISNPDSFPDADNYEYCMVPHNIPDRTYFDALFFSMFNLLKEARMFEIRRDYLQGVRDEAQEKLDELQTAMNKIDGLLNDGRVDDIIKYWKDLEENNRYELAKLAPWVIYGYKDPKGYWHLVQSQAAMPGKCAGKCSRKEELAEPRWPWIKTYNKNRGMSRCYTLLDSYAYPESHCDDDNLSGFDAAKDCFQGGRVKSRVITYDQDRDLSLKFANNVPLWKFIFRHPAQQGSTAADIAAIETYCDKSEDGSFMINNDGVSTPADPLGGGAFSWGFDQTCNQLSGRYVVEKSNCSPCFDAASRLLKKGVMSDTCADYSFRQNRWPFSFSNGFQVHFVPCGKDGANPF